MAQLWPWLPLLFFDEVLIGPVRFVELNMCQAE
jgi:hypothetical protein